MNIFDEIEKFRVSIEKEIDKLEPTRRDYLLDVLDEMEAKFKQTFVDTDFIDHD